MRMTIAVLEDNAERIATMRDNLTDKFPFFELQFFASAGPAITWLQEHLDAVICLSLDHDLERQLNEPDPGTGRDVADFLTTQAPRFPIVIHSTNVHAAIGMEAALQDADWTVSRLTPYGNLEWIAEAWLPILRAAIVAQAAGLEEPLAAPFVDQ